MTPGGLQSQVLSTYSYLGAVCKRNNANYKCGATMKYEDARNTTVWWQINTRQTGNAAATALANKRWWEGPSLVKPTKEPRRRCKNGIGCNIQGPNKRSRCSSPNMAKITTFRIHEERCSSFFLFVPPSIHPCITIGHGAQAPFVLSRGETADTHTKLANWTVFTCASVSKEQNRTQRPLPSSYQTQPCLPSSLVIAW